MMFNLLYQLSSVFCISNATLHYTTSRLDNNNNLYIYNPYDVDLESATISIYKLEDGLLNDLNMSTITLKNISDLYLPQFLKMPDNLENGRSEEIWLLGASHESTIINTTISKMEWTSQFINNKLEFNSDFIPIPNFPNFPKLGYTQTLTNINNNPSLLILGGVVYSNKLKDQAITNCLFKFDYVTKTWSDLSNYTIGKIPPIAGHKAALIENNDLLVLGGFSPIDEKTNFTQIGPTYNITEYNYMEQMWKFNLDSLEWSNVTATLNREAEIYDAGAFLGPSVNYNQGKLYVYGVMYNFEIEEFESHLGILDTSSFQWDWVDLMSEENIDYNLALNFHDSLLIGDQLILIHGVLNKKDSKRLYVINLTDKKFKSYLNISGNYDNSSKKSSLPLYAKIIIGIFSGIVGVVLIIILILYLRYKKRLTYKKSESKLKMVEVWSSPAHGEREGFLPNNEGKIDLYNYNDEQTNLISTGTGTNTTSTSSNTMLLMNLSHFKYEIDDEDLVKSPI